MELTGKKVNFLGDSITQGIGVKDPANRYPDRLAARYGLIVRNYGIRRTRIARQHVPSEDPAKDLDFCGRVAGMDDDADLVLVFGGTNDFGHGDAPLGEMSDRTPYTFYGALHTLYGSLIKKYPDAVIVVLTPLHRLQEDDPATNAFRKGYVPLKRFVEAIREVAEYYALPVLDLHASSGLQPKVPAIRERYVPDGLHPNDAGHAILAERIGAFLTSCI
ncbi:MAG: SGNH/GDSL hydrolase family protein [Oscillospiraceae bacterium]|nr:SGNH/GDSL hydrolase family protein [Oscillospiraceae bacterium]